MMKWFKKYFIPCEDNNHQPYFLRSHIVAYIAICIVFFEVLFLTQIYILPRTNLLGLIISDTIIDETNANRSKEDLGALTVNQVLNEAAQLKANDMAAKGYFAHTSPEGFTPWHWFNKAGYSFYYAGENLAVNFVDSKDIVNAWMESPSHRANIINYNFTEIGIGIA
ncbi:MAG TPA: CAP domain-containing protein, partial [Candidatus Paceibacterota bacterium]|nr:CAP domain-containing protein [Candidatus Paceibacterota bacterium]